MMVKVNVGLFVVQVLFVLIVVVLCVIVLNSVK